MQFRWSNFVFTTVQGSSATYNTAKIAVRVQSSSVCTATDTMHKALQHYQTCDFLRTSTVVLRYAVYQSQFICSVTSTEL